MLVSYKLSPNAFWKMRKSVNKNPSLKFRAIYKSNGKVTTNEDEIKDEIRKEFEHRLRNREPEECWEGYVEATNSVVEQLLRETNDNSLPFSQEELVDAISKMKKGTSPDYYGMHVDIIAKSGDGILKPLLQVLNIGSQDNIQNTRNMETGTHHHDIQKQGESSQSGNVQGNIPNDNSIKTI